MKNKMVLGLFLVLLSISIVGCGTKQSAKDSESKKTIINVGIPKAPPALPVLYMMEQQSLGDSVDIKIDIWDEPETLLAMVQDKKHDMYAFPLTVISKLYNKGMDLRLMNVNTWGVTYFMTTDDTLKDWSDLKGKTVYVPLQSSPPDALTQYFLSNTGLKVGKDVNIVYASTSEIASLLASGEAKYATLIEPQVTKAMMKNKDVRVAFRFEEEWKKVTNTDTKIPNAGFGTTQTFIDNNPELTSQFQKAYEEACKWVNENPEEAAKLAEKYLGLEKSLVEKAIPSMGLEFKSAVDSDKELKMFYGLLDVFDTKMIGSKIPDEKMYYEGE